MRDATSLDGSRVVFKVVDGDTHELEILKYLNEIKEAANHAIELHGVVDVTVATVIALPWRLPLNMYFNPSSPPKSAALFPEQFLEGVAFLHAHKVAHLDLKPGNVVIEHPQRLIIIDFDLSIFVEDESTTTKGFRGTPPWVAPEVGTRDGPEMSFSPILADRWACGRMVRHLEALEERPRGDGDGRRYRILEKLMSENPRSRPSLKDALDGNGRRWVKRIAEAEKSGGGMQKKPRMMYVSHHFTYFYWLLLTCAQN
jgi:serine/threonine protein kinase